MPSQAQIEQLRSLPRAQQEQLARQFGVDLQMLDQLDRRDGQSSRQRQAQEDVVFPRGTEFDQYGDPIIPDDLERQFTRDDDELKAFGYDLFAGQPRTFAPTSHAPVPSNYIVGVGDTVRVQLFGQEDRSYDLVVDREGTVVIPRLGEINVTGITYTAMQELIKHRVNERLIGYRAAVSMGELRSIQVFIVGEAYQPGAYTVSSLSTLSQALYVAGGVSDIASLRSIRLMRGGEVASELDLYDLLMRGDASADRTLQSGDVIFIPPRGDMITVKGEVNRPALYELKGSETLADAIRLAGGVKSEAYMGATQVRRVRDGRRAMSTVDLTAGRNLERSVQGGDVITIPAVSDTLDNSILLVGAVSRPGNYEWREGLRINDVLRSSRHDLLEQTDLGYGLVVREQGARRSLEVYQFDVALAIEGEPQENLQLHERDQVLLFSRYQSREEERQNISRLAMTQQERDQEHRRELLESYRRAYLENLVSDEVGDNGDEAEERRRRELRTPLRDLFGTPDVDDSTEGRDLADFSRERMLEPLMQRLQRQRTERGNTPFVYVAGEVHHPGIYPLVQNATASRLLAAAGGLQESAYLERAEVTRMSVATGDAQTEYHTLNLLDVILGNEDMELQGRDRLNILSIPEWQNTYEVTLRGEVRFPGTYAIRRGEKLTALIERAGGFTDFAFVEGAVFTRKELRQQERQRMDRLAEELQREIASNAITGTGGSNQPYGEMRTLLGDLMAVEPIGRLIVDLPRVLAGESSTGDIQLKDGDVLHVPSRQDSISIMGEVQMATSYRYDRELTVSDYINMSGGTKQKADERRIYVVRANGAIEPHRQRRGWFSSTGSAELRPGDAIIVPLNTTYTENLQLWAQVTSILYNSAVAVAAINSI
ncbi:MAG: SLBB domain-containing protein [Idiomarina sp.]|nr:SLBB domain-containing protein [Idiomarina sp.]